MASPAVLRSPFDVTDLSNKREVGSDPGTLWSLSSQKPGYGVKQLRDPDLESLWQSDGVQPHKINIEFARRTAVTHVSLWMNVKRDDSYTPTKISVKAGTGWHDMTEVRYREWEKQDEPYGWKHFLLSSSSPRSTRDEEDEATTTSLTSQASNGATEDLKGRGAVLAPIHVWVVQIAILANQQNGKDTHIRSCLIWGPREGPGSDVRGIAGRREVEGGSDEEEEDEDEELRGGGAAAGAGLRGLHMGSAHSPWRAIR